MEVNIPQSERRKIKNSLKFGDISRIAKLSGKSRSTVKRWFLGEANGFEIPDAIVSLIKARQKTLEGFKNSIKSIEI